MNIKKLIEYPKEGILSKDIINDNFIRVSLFCMAKDAEISEHTSTKRVIIHILEGDGMFFIGKKKIRMIPGEIIKLYKNQKHSLKSFKKTAFVLIFY
jgi:nitric oxide dioxygenase